ncbi:MAG: Ppx/GppA phosphatase family protein [Burkholderiaceae bacterium]
MESDDKPAEGQGLLAAVDLGSNSFRLLIGRIERAPMGEQIRPIDSLKEAVRQAAGLQADGTLDLAARRRGVAAMARFGERLRSFAPERVRAVGTNTLRVARNVSAFLVPAQTALGFPIEVISGREEARLIYLGASHALPLDGQHRLVVDIGGGSTELILGHNHDPILFESVPIGCVSLTQRFFPDGKISAAQLRRARLAARDALAPYALAYRDFGWDYTVGTSGTAKSLSQIAEREFGCAELDLGTLEKLGNLLAEAGNAFSPRIAGLRADRRPVLPGGLALMHAVFEEFGVKSIRYSDGALRQGVLYDILGRKVGHDMRRITVERMAIHYQVDRAHANRVASMGLALFDQLVTRRDEDNLARRDLLSWAAELAEIGLSISHDGYHKHSAYILTHADMPGFTRAEQRVLAMLALGQTGGLRKLEGTPVGLEEWLMIACLRIAVILHRHRDAAPRALPTLTVGQGRLEVRLPARWCDEHPLTHQSMQAESALWQEIRALDVSYVTSD